jgi:hypothetical protein
MEMLNGGHEKKFKLILLLVFPSTEPAEKIPSRLTLHDKWLIPALAIKLGNAFQLPHNSNKLWL